MEYLICYDVSETKIRNGLVKFLETFAWRLQGSVFYCEHLPMTEDALISRMEAITSGASCRRLLVAPFCGHCEERMWMVGAMEEKGTEYIAI